MTKQRFTSYLEEETIQQLRELSEKSRIPISAFVEEAVKDLIEKYENTVYYKK
jgi:predicted DNA-binding protein